MATDFDMETTDVKKIKNIILSRAKNISNTEEYDIEDNENLMGPDKGNLYFTTFNENGIDVRKISIT